MARELELKYSSLEGRVPSQAELQAALAPLGLQVAAEGAREQADVYFDDAARSLERAGLALRVRRSAGGRVAAVKSRGNAVEGLFEREELEAPMPADDAPGAERPAAWPAAIAERLAGVVALGAVAPLLRIGTTREVFAISRAGTSVAELSFDEVSCRPPSGADDALIDEVMFSEVEVEAAAGCEPALLRSIGAALEGLTPLVPATVSKLERATVLLSPFL